MRREAQSNGLRALMLAAACVALVLVAVPAAQAGPRANGGVVTPGAAPEAPDQPEPPAVASTWAPASRLAWTAGDSDWPRVAVSGASVHVVWMQERNTGSYDLMYAGSSDGGATWAPARFITATAGNAAWSSVAADGSDVHVVWRRGRTGGVDYVRSTDGGATWSTIRQIAAPGCIYAVDRCTPAIAVSGQTVHVAWQNSADGGDVFYRRSTDGGATWSTGRRMNSGDADCGEAFGLSIATEGSDVYYAFMIEDCPTLHGNANTEIYIRHSTDGGVTWGAPHRRTWGDGQIDWPSLYVNAGTVNLSFTHYEGQHEIWFKKTNAAGVDWSRGRQVSYTPSTSYYSDVACTTDGSAHVGWEEAGDDIYVKASSDGFATSTEAARTAASPWSSIHINLDADGNVVHAVWRQLHADGNWNVWYRNSASP